MSKERPSADRRARFAQEYCVDFNATQAAIRAGYSEATAKQQGSRLLTYADVLRQIDSINAAAAAACGITRERTQRQIARLAFADIGELFDEKGALKPLHTLTPDARAQVAAIEVDEIFEGTGEERRAVGVIRKVRLRDIGKALDQCIQILGLARQLDPAAVGGGLRVTIVPYSERRTPPGARRSGSHER